MNLANPQNENEIQNRAYDPSECGFAENFCARESKYPPVVARISNGSGVGVIIEVGNKEFKTFPFKLFDGTTGIIVKAENDIYIGHQSNNEYLKSKNQVVELPNQLGKLLTIEYNANFTLENITNRIWTSTGIINEGNTLQPKFNFSTGNWDSKIT
ncbi:MAG: hypothetical protein KA974_02940 [Saprospiraceae bacterium]|nr:hypothetical protein [Saprospiraceae bacterium]MBP7679414.1 hypothetical protein [Saprospiraceae bacterium]